MVRDRGSKLFSKLPIALMLSLSPFSLTLTPTVSFAATLQDPNTQQQLNRIATELDTAYASLNTTQKGYISAEHAALLGANWDQIITQTVSSATYQTPLAAIAQDVANLSFMDVQNEQTTNASTKISALITDIQSLANAEGKTLTSADVLAFLEAYKSNYISSLFSSSSTASSEALRQTYQNSSGNPGVDHVVQVLSTAGYTSGDSLVSLKSAIENVDPVDYNQATHALTLGFASQYFDVQTNGTGSDSSGYVVNSDSTVQLKVDPRLQTDFPSTYSTFTSVFGGSNIIPSVFITWKDSAGGVSSIIDSTGKVQVSSLSTSTPTSLTAYIGNFALKEIKLTAYASGGGGSSSGGGGGSSSGGGSVPVAPPATTGPQAPATPATDISSSAQVTVSSTGVAQVSIDSSKAISSINSAPAGTTAFEISIPTQTSVSVTAVSVPISADIVQAAAAKGGVNASIVIATPLGNYNLPVAALNLDAGAKVSVTISQADQATSQTVTTNVAAQGFAVVGTPINFSVSTTDASGNTKSVESFGNLYVSRSVNAGVVNPDNTVAVMLTKDGQIVPVPTFFVKQDDGTYLAVINRTGNSTYAIVTGTKTFSDIQGHWSQADVEKMASHLLVKGETDTTFNPNGDITRAEFASLLVRALGISDRTGNSSYSDVSDSDWFAHDVNVASSVSLVKGYNGAFNPNAKITREEMAIMIARAIAFVNLQVGGTDSLSQFHDGGQVDTWAASAVAASIRAGIVKGDDNGNIQPQANATRAEATVMLERFMKYANFLN